MNYLFIVVNELEPKYKEQENKGVVCLPEAQWGATAQNVVDYLALHQSTGAKSPVDQVFVIIHNSSALENEALKAIDVRQPQHFRRWEYSLKQQIGLSGDERVHVWGISRMDSNKLYAPLRIYTGNTPIQMVKDVIEEIEPDGLAEAYEICFSVVSQLTTLYLLLETFSTEVGGIIELDEQETRFLRSLTIQMNPPSDFPLDSIPQHDWPLKSLIQELTALPNSASICPNAGVALNALESLDQTLSNLYPVFIKFVLGQASVEEIGSYLGQCSMDDVFKQVDELCRSIGICVPNAPFSPTGDCASAPV